MDETAFEFIGALIGIGIAIFLASRKFTSMDKDIAQLQKDLAELKKRLFGN